MQTTNINSYIEPWTVTEKNYKFIVTSSKHPGEIHEFETLDFANAHKKFCNRLEIEMCYPKSVQYTFLADGISNCIGVVDYNSYFLGKEMLIKFNNSGEITYINFKFIFKTCIRLLSKPLFGLLNRIMYGEKGKA